MQILGIPFFHHTLEVGGSSIFSPWFIHWVILATLFAFPSASIPVSPRPGLSPAFSLRPISTQMSPPQHPLSVPKTVRTAPGPDGPLSSCVLRLDLLNQMEGSETALCRAFQLGVQVPFILFPSSVSLLASATWCQCGPRQLSLDDPQRPSTPS